MLRDNLANQLHASLRRTLKQPAPLTTLLMQTPQTPVAPSAPVAAPTAAQMFQAAKAVREVLGDQLSRLQNKRENLAEQLREPATDGMDRSGLEARLKDIDARILDMDKQIAVADANTAKAASLPGATEEPIRPPRPGPSDAAYATAAFGIFIIGFPIAFAYARRIWRRSAKVTVTLPPEVASRMQAMEEAIESIAVEVERVGEGQRFMTQALSDPTRQLNNNAAEPFAVRQREAVHAERPL